MWNYRVVGPRQRETVLLAYGCFSDGGRMDGGGAKIFLVTDHNPLVFLTSAAPQCPRLQRSCEFCQAKGIDIDSEVDSDDVQELLDSYNQELTMDELIEKDEQEQDIEEFESLESIQ
ncbi:hypothetical protein TNCV_1181241 [Trichonephila clavipes]|nr:hypothetical protein TNCV_1181241 [Trichonephila clavipes]